MIKRKEYQKPIMEIQMQNIILEELKEIKSLISQNTIRKYLDMRQLIEWSSLSSSTIRRAVKRGSLKVSRKTGKLLFDINDVKKWLNG